MAVEHVPTVSSLDQIYQQSDLPPQSARLNAIRKLFVEKYGREPDFFARSPGRVNLIGEHIDYCGFSVFPMAVDKDIVIAVGIDGNSRRVRLANVDEKYPPLELELSSAEEGYCPINAAVHEWSNYFKCGVRGILEHVRPDAPKGMACIVSGTVPSGAGLSSSSAFVCCSALATLTANGATLTKTELAEIAIRAERYVGVNSGGMDQTVSIFSIPNHALHVEFQPKLRTTPIPFPVTEPPLVFVIADTLVVSNKRMSAPVCYNLRVVETRAAALALARALDLSVEQYGELNTLREVCIAYFSTRASQNELVAETVGLWKRMLEEMIELVELHLRQREGYTKEEMIKATGVTDFESRYMRQFPVRADVFHLFTRAKHVYSESLRVYEFRDTCEKCFARVEQDTPSGAEVLQKLGSLMNMSQDSCRDDFDCSCPEIDELVGHCRLAGALGSRLTGAGWGGCTVSLVPETIIEEFIDKVKDAYYRPRGLSEQVIKGAIFATRPGNGAAVMKF